MSTEAFIDIKVNLEGGFFYKTNKRGVSGLDWFCNDELEDEVRNCPHSIAIGQKVVESLQSSDHLRVAVWRFSVRENRRVFRGEYRISANTIRWWLEQNGYYKAESGKLILAIPCPVLWEVVKEGEKKKEKQLRLM